MKDLKTTVFGTLASILGSLATIDTPYQKLFAAGAAICGTLFALFSKDISGVQKLVGGNVPPNKDEK
jgi:hypothetical protein